MMDPRTVSVLVTGASRGIGSETVLRLAEAGFHVWAGVRTQQAASVIQRAAQDRGARVDTVLLDVTDSVSIDRAFDTIANGTQPLYAVVNNAGVTARGFFEDFTEADIRRILEVNLLGTMRVTRRALPLLREARRGRIVMVSSVAGRIGQVCLAPYSATKFGLEGLAESLWLELQPFGIDVTIIEPGIVATTDIWSDPALPAARDARSPYAHLFPVVEKQAAKLLNAARLTPADVAGQILHAITTPRPKMRYVAGYWTGWLLRAKRYLPDRVFQRAYLRLWSRDAEKTEPAAPPEVVNLR